MEGTDLISSSAIFPNEQSNIAISSFRVIGLLIAKGYMELEETVKQWKQKTHLLRILEVSSSRLLFIFSFSYSNNKQI